MNNEAIARRVVANYTAAYKEKPETKRSRIQDAIRAIGVSVGMAKDIADKMVAKHGDLSEILRLALQKGWPVNDEGILEGSKGTLDLSSMAT